MMKNSMKKLKLVIVFILSFINILIAQDATISVDPSVEKQQVIFGGDGKLTIKSWAEGSPEQISQKLFRDMKLEILRVPIFPLQPITNGIYDNVIHAIKIAQQINPELKIFASVANGDGYGVDYHGASKFPTNWVGCCPNNVYSLNLTAFASYLDSFMALMEENNIKIDYFGPFNEDAAGKSDYEKVFSQMKKLGNTTKIGMESWGLQTAINKVNDVENQLDIIGSHFYDDETLSDWDGKWGELVQKTELPVWYTESTRYTTTDGIDKLIAGINNVLPAINGGADAVIFYQIVPRFVRANGNVSGQYKYTGFQNLVNTSYGKSVIPVSIQGENIRATSFYGGDTAYVYITNSSSMDKTTRIQLENSFRVNGSVTRTIWTSEAIGVSNSFTLNGNIAWNITLPAMSYVFLKIPVVNSLITSNNWSIKSTEFCCIDSPFENQLTVTLNNETNFSTILLNAKGQIVKSTNQALVSTVNLPTQDLSSGVYYLQIITEDKHHTFKVYKK